MIMSTILIGNRPAHRVEIGGTELLSSELTQKVGEALDRAEDLGASAVMVVHVVGAMNSGAFRPWPGSVDIGAIQKWERVLRRIARSHVATIVLVEHACSALALQLLLLADRRLARGSFSLRFSEGNVWPGMALYRLSRQIGESQARRLLLDAANVTAEQCIELNIIDKIVDNSGDGFDPAAHLLEYVPSDEFAVCRRLMQDSLSTSFDDALGLHMAACDRLLRRGGVERNRVNP